MLDYSDPVARAMVDHRFGVSGAPMLDLEQQNRIASVRESARLMARHVVSTCPPSYERDEALTAIDNAASWAARSIARNEGGPEE